MPHSFSEIFDRVVDPAALLHGAFTVEAWVNRTTQEIAPGADEAIVTRYDIRDDGLSWALTNKGAD